MGRRKKPGKVGVRVSRPLLFEVHAGRCPFCNHGPLDACTGALVGDRDDVLSTVGGPTLRPGPGDFTVCGGCGGVLVFAGLPGNLIVRRAGPAELDAFKRDNPEAWRVVRSLSDGFRRKSP